MSKIQGMDLEITTAAALRAALQRACQTALERLWFIHSAVSIIFSLKLICILPMHPPGRIHTNSRVYEDGKHEVIMQI